MGSNDAPDNEKTQSISAGFGCKIGLENAGDVFRRDTSTGVREDDLHMGGIRGGADAQDAPGIHGLKRIAADVVEGLLDLVAVDLKERQSLLKLLLNEHIAVLDFDMQEFKNLIDDAVDIRGFGIEALGTDGAEKLCDDVVEARDLAAGHENRLLEFGAEFWRSLLQIALHELKVDVERVEGIPDFMGNTGSQHGEGGEFFDFDRLLRVAMGLCDVTKDDRTTDRLGFVSIAFVAQQRNHIKI